MHLSDPADTSADTSRHVTVDVYAFSTVWVWVHRVDTVWTFTGLVDLRTVAYRGLMYATFHGENFFVGQCRTSVLNISPDLFFQRISN